MATETRGFQTEAKKLLQLMINSLYSNKEIFLRELISNASDAIDKLRFESLANPELIAEDSDYRIRIEFDKEEGTLTISDNGIGMSRDEVVDNLGTIAKSGTEEFFSQLTGDQKQDSALIGQFGVGFYSAFIVADEVEVRTCRAGSSEGTLWTSTGEDDFTIGEEECSRGTKVTLRLKKDASEFADGYRLRNIVTRYSDHIGIPVEMLEELPPKSDDDDSDTEETLPSMEVVNSARALWSRSRTDVKDEEYQEFYKHISHDFEDPAHWSHNKVEGKLEYTSLLFLPKRAPFDLWNREAPKGLKLYVQRVFIMDEAEQFLPLYLRFVRGIVDSNDLPLNVSRELLQESPHVTSIRNALTKRVLDMFSKVSADDQELYGELWDEFGQVLKEGVGEDFTNRDALLKLFRFASTKDASEDKQRVSLLDYVSRAKDDQDKIYFLVAESLAAARQSPHLETFNKQEVEVLLLFDRVDEWFVSFVEEFEGKKFQNVMRGDLNLAKGDQEQEDSEEKDDPLLDRIKTVLESQVETVRKSKRLTESAACLVLGDEDMGYQMRRMMEAAGQPVPESKPHLEVNLDHPLLGRLDKEQDEERFQNIVRILFDQAALADGTSLAEPGEYVKRINQLIVELME
jgi:molecular chaperone HtpG